MVYESHNRLRAYGAVLAQCRESLQFYGCNDIKKGWRDDCQSYMNVCSCPVVGFLLSITSLHTNMNHPHFFFMFLVIILHHCMNMVENELTRRLRIACHLHEGSNVQKKINHGGTFQPDADYSV